MKRNIRDEKGFTLMELMMVVSITIIITSLSIYNLLAKLPSYRLRSTANEIAATLQYLKIRAVTTNRVAWLEVNYSDADNNFFTGFVDLDDFGTANVPGEYDATNLDFPDQVGSVDCFLLPKTITFGFPSDFTSGNGPDNSAFPGAGNFITTYADGGTSTSGYIGYRPTGVPVIDPVDNETPNLPMVIYLTNTIDEGYAVSVLITGRVKVFKWSGGRWIS